MMKQNLIPFTAVLAAFALVSCDGGKKQDQSPDASAASEQAVPKTPGEKILAVLLLIQDQATAMNCSVWPAGNAMAPCPWKTP